MFTNQIRLKIGIMFGNPETTPGGLALKFYCSVRMDVRKIETLKRNNMVYGARIRIKIVKNKVAPPFKEAEIIITAEGIDKAEALLDAAIAAGVLTKSGAFLKLDDKLLGQGKEQVKLLLTQDAKLKQHLTKEVLEKTLGKK